MAKKDIALVQTEIVPTDVHLALNNMRVAPAISTVGTDNYFAHLDNLAGENHVVVLGQNESSLFKSRQLIKYNALAIWLHERGLFNYKLCALFALYEDEDFGITVRNIDNKYQLIIDQEKLKAFLQTVSHLWSIEDLYQLADFACLAADADWTVVYRELGIKNKFEEFKEGTINFDALSEDIRARGIRNLTVLIYPMDTGLKVEDERIGWNPIRNDRPTPKQIHQDLNAGVDKLITVLVRYLEYSVLTNTLYLQGEIHTLSYLQNNALYYIVSNLQLNTFVPLGDHVNPIVKAVVKMLTTSFATHGISMAAVEAVRSELTQDYAVSLKKEFDDWLLHLEEES